MYGGQAPSREGYVQLMDVGDRRFIQMYIHEEDKEARQRLLECIIEQLALSLQVIQHHQAYDQIKDVIVSV